MAIELVPSIAKSSAIPGLLPPEPPKISHVPPTPLLNLAYDLIAPFMRYVTIGTDRAHAGTIGVMYGFTDFSDNGGVTARAEGFGISRLHAGVKGTPEQYAANKTHAQ